MPKRLLVLYTLLILSIAAHLAADDCHPGFESAEKIGTEKVSSAAWGDFDGDGRSDVAVMTLGDHLSVLMNRGNSVFQTRFQMTLESGILGQAFVDPLIRAEDVNGDGRLDLIYYGSMLRVALGHGNGEFDPLISSPVGSFGSWRFADVNGDGRTDLVHFDLGRVSAELSQGDGRFAPTTQLVNLRILQNFQFAVADFDGDGYNDIYQAGITSFNGQGIFTHSIWWNDGKGGFPTHTEITLSVLFPSAPAAEMLDAWDFEGDGGAGVLLRDPQTGAKQLLTAKNRAIVMRPIDVADAIQNAPATPLTGVGDFDADGNRDALFADGTVVWGGGTAQRVEAAVFDLAGDSATSANYGARAADVNGDGISDIAGTGGSNGVHAIYGKRHSRKLAGGSIIASAAQPASLVAGDVNGDGIVDVVIDSIDNNALVATYLGDGRGGFVPSATHVLDAATSGRRALADFDGDGKADLLFGNYAVASNVGFGDGAGHFSPLASFPATAVLGAGRIDSSGRVGAFLLSGTTIQLVTFGSDRTSSTSQVLNIAPNASAIPADVDGDGITDIVVDGGTAVQVIKKTPAGWSVAAQLSGLLALPVSQVVAADFDGDGRRDLLTCAELACDLSLATPGGYAAARHPFPYPAFGARIQGISSADVDRDGHPDVIALVGVNPGMIFVARNTGSGTFESMGVSDATSGFGFFVADVDGDSASDVVLVSHRGLGVIRNGCAPSPLRVTVLPESVYVTDRPVLLVNAVSPRAPGPLTLREGATVIATQSVSSSTPLAETSFVLPPLSPGSHTFTVTGTAEYLGTLEATVTINVTPSLPRKRAVHH